MKRLLLFWSLCFLLACSPSQVEVASDEILNTQENNQPLVSANDDPYPVGTPTPVDTATPRSYPVEMPTSLPPTETPAVPPTIRPSDTPTSIPTATPIPTPLVLSDSNSAIWVETYNFDKGVLPDGVTSRTTIFEADPRDMASRQTVLEIPDKHVLSATLSPDGSHIALLAVAGDPWQGFESELWLYQIGDTVLQQIAPIAFDVQWATSGQQLVYTTFVDELLVMQLFDTTSRQSSALVQGDESTEHIQPLSWVEPDTLYYMVRLDTDNERYTGANRHEFRSLQMPSRATENLMSFENSVVNGFRLSVKDDKAFFSIVQDSDSFDVIADFASQTQSLPSISYKHIEWLTTDTLLGIRPNSAYVYDVDLQSEEEIHNFDQTVWGINPASPDGEWVYIQFANQGWYFWHLDSDSFVPLPQGKNSIVTMAGWR